MRHRVALMAPVSELDSLGEDLPAWQEVATVWAEVRDAQAGETVYADQTISQRTLVVTIRWRPGVTSAMKVVHNGDIYNVETVSDPDQRRRFLILTCIGEAE